MSAVQGQNIVMADRVGDEQLVVRWLCLYGADGVVGNSACFVGVSRFAWSSLPGKVVTRCNYHRAMRLVAGYGSRFWLKAEAQVRKRRVGLVLHGFGHGPVATPA